MLNFESLTLEQIVFEVRFDHGYLYLDKTGEILSRLSEKWPKMKIRASVEGTAAKLEEEGINGSFSATRIGIDQNYPRKLDVYKKFSADLYDLVCDSLALKVFQRVGNRYQYILPLKDFNEIDDIFMRKYLSAVLDKAQELRGKFTQPGLHFRIQLEEITLTVRMELFERELQITPLPKPFIIDTSKWVKYGFSIDIDCYSSKLVERSIFRADDFISTQERNVKRAIETLLG